MPDWRQAYSAVVCETNAVRLAVLIREFEDLAAKCAMELTAHPDPVESLSLESALAHVLTIKRQRLGRLEPSLRS